MKRMLLLLVGCLLTSWSFAADYLTWLDPETGITWNYTASGSLGIINNDIYAGYGVPACRDISRSEIVIPAKVAGLSISSIMVGWGLWPASDSLLVENVKKVIVSEGIKRLEAYAFAGADALESVQLPSSLELIGSADAGTIGAFRDCSSLKEVTFGENMQRLVIEDKAFYGCTNLTTLKNVTDCVIFSDRNSANKSFYDSKLTVYDYGFYDSVKMEALLGFKSNMSSVHSATIPNTFVLPKGVRFICGGVFKGSSITSITLSEGLEGIGENAFANCTGLTEVKLPKSLKRLGDGVFSGCTSIPSSGTGEQYESSDKQVLISGSYASNVTIPNTVRFIHSDAFKNRTNLTSVTIPSSVTSIGSSAFEGCTGLTSVTIPEGVTSIPDYAFRNCSSLTSVTIPSSVTSIGDYAFDGCSSLTSVTIPEGVTSIGDGAFRGCSKLTSVTIPKGVTSIGYQAFYNCSGLTSVTIPEGVTSIGGGAFRGCVSLTSVTIPEGVTSISNGVFSGCSGLTSVTIPEGVTSIGYEAFYNCSGLTSVTIPEGVTSIGNYAFQNCSSLTSITIPSSVTTIGAKAFEGCSSLEKVIFKGNPPTASSDSFILCDGYYPSTKATEWSKVIQSVSWNNLRMISYQLVTLSFNANGGTGGGSDEYIVGMSLQAPSVSREGYTFKGWSPSVPTQVPEIATTYTAQWQVNQYTMTFNANGGEGGKTLTQDYGSRVTAPTVTRVGYMFTGWSPNVPSKIPAKNTFYTAQWKVNQYTQTFDANGGEGGTSVKQDYGSTLVAPVVTREGYAFNGWLPEVPTMVPAENVTYMAQWEIVEIPDEPGDEPEVHTPPSWSVSNYQNNMVVYAQVKDVTTGAFLEAEGSLLGAFDANGVCRGVVGLLDIGLEHQVYQLTVCSDETSGEELTLKIWDAATGEITELNDKVTFAADTEIGLLWEPVVYEIGLKALSMTLNPGWNWCSINVAMPEGTTLSEFFTDWTPQNGDQVKAGAQTATYFNGAWRPTDFVMKPGMMYLIKNGTDAAVTTTVMGTPADMDETIDIATGWNWVGYTGAEPIAAANAFVDNSMFANGDVLKSNAASATFYNGAWRGVLTLTPGVGYKLKVASSATIQYARPTATATTMAAPVAMTASASAPDWKVSNYQYNMVVYASIQNAQGVSLEADGNLLAAFDANGVCRGVIDPLDIGIGVKVYQLTVCSDDATESGLTLKLWDAATNTIYDVNGTIDFKSDTEIGLLWEPQVYTVVETAVKFDVAANVIGDGTVTGAGAYEAGETVTLTATPAEGFVFCGWSIAPVSMEATYSFTMPEGAVTLTAYFAPAAALNNYVAGQGFVSADEVDAKIQEYIAEKNLKTPEEVEAAIDAHVAANGLLTPAEANQQTQKYIADNELMSKDEAKQELLDADEVFTEDEMKALALGAPVIQVKNGKATVSIQVQQASELNGEWEVVEDGEVSVQITPKAGEKAGFYKFVVPNKQ